VFLNLRPACYAIMARFKGDVIVIRYEGPMVDRKCWLPLLQLSVLAGDSVGLITDGRFWWYLRHGCRSRCARGSGWRYDRPCSRRHHHHHRRPVASASDAEVRATALLGNHANRVIRPVCWQNTKWFHLVVSVHTDLGCKRLLF